MNCVNICYDEMISSAVHDVTMIQILSFTRGERICRVCNLITDNETGEVLSEGSDLIQSVFSDD